MLKSRRGLNNVYEMKDLIRLRVRRGQYAGR